MSACDRCGYDRRLVREKLDELILAARNHWGAGSEQHNLVRDVADALLRATSPQGTLTHDR